MNAFTSAGVRAWLYHDGPSPEQVPCELVGSRLLSFERRPNLRNEMPLLALPPELVRYMLRELKSERASLEGFLRLDNERGRAERLDRWIACLAGALLVDDDAKAARELPAPVEPVPKEVGAVSGDEPSAAQLSQQLDATMLAAQCAANALELIATPKRPDGTWNRDRLACQQLARSALDRLNADLQGVRPAAETLGSSEIAAATSASSAVDNEQGPAR